MPHSPAATSDAGTSATPAPRDKAGAGAGGAETAGGAEAAGGTVADGGSDYEAAEVTGVAAPDLEELLADFARRLELGEVDASTVQVHRAAWRRRVAAHGRGRTAAHPRGPRRAPPSTVCGRSSQTRCW